jgi:hypothetical protein
LVLLDFSRQHFENQSVATVAVNLLPFLRLLLFNCCRFSLKASLLAIGLSGLPHTDAGPSGDPFKQTVDLPGIPLSHIPAELAQDLAPDLCGANSVPRLQLAFVPKSATAP